MTPWITALWITFSAIALPSPPTWVHSSLIVSISGVTLATAASSPDAITAAWPRRICATPARIAASTISRPAGAQRSLSAMTSAGLTVLVSTTTDPGARTEDSSLTTLSEASRVGSESTAMSAADSSGRPATTRTGTASASLSALSRSVS